MSRIWYFAAGVVLGAAPLSLARSSVGQDPVVISPQYYSVRFEDERVRVLEYRLKPGEHEDMHSHPPGVVYVFGDSTIRTTLPDGTSRERPAKAGEVFWRDATKHAVINVGNTEAHALGIDLKECKP